MANTVLNFAIYHQGSFQRRATVQQDIVKIGNDANSHLRVSDPSSARMQAVIEVVGPHDVTLIDLGNEPRTRVNGATVNKIKLQIGDQIQIGDASFVLEAAETRSAVEPHSNPFAAPVTEAFRVPSATLPRAPLFGNPFARPPSASESAFEVTSDGAAAPAHYGYTLLKSGPDVDPEEVELSHVLSLEVLVLWGDNVLSVSHLTPPRNFYVGEEEDKHVTCDFFVPSERLGTTRMPLVLVDGGQVSLLIPENARGYLELPGGPKQPLGEVRASARVSAQLTGAHECALPGGAKARLEIGGFVFQVAAVNAGKPLKRGLAAAWDWNVASFFGLSFLTHASILAAMAFFLPSLNGLGDEDSDRDRLYVMQQFLDSAAEREQERERTENVQPQTEQNGGTGQQAAAEAGSMGNRLSHAKNKSYAVQGPKDNPDPHIARARALREASEFGMISLLSGDPNAPTAPWGRDTALGTDEVSANGNMWGTELGEAFGAGGLTLSGLGDGGGGRGVGIGMGPLGTIGRGLGLGDGQGIGNGSSNGLSNGRHATKVPRMREGSLTVSGRLPPEVVQRIVRQNFGRFRMCYQSGLGRNPSLEGRVSARFVIGRDGSVANVSNGGSDLPDSAVVSCVLSAFYGLSFPEPQGGIVTVAYPIMLAPG
jgi:hypothetical protein